MYKLLTTEYELIKYLSYVKMMSAITNRPSLKDSNNEELKTIMSSTRGIRAISLTFAKIAIIKSAFMKSLYLDYVVE